jgi:adenine deaminase
MKVMLRHGSAWFDIAAGARAITEHGLDTRNFLICTDDMHPGSLLSEGHVDRALRFAIAQGIPPMTALQMATINTAEHFGVARDVGQIAPGRYADIVLTASLTDFRAECVIAAGELIVDGGQWRVDLPVFDYPADVKRSVHIGRARVADDFAIPAPAGAKSVRAHVIGVIENQAPTRKLTLRLPAHAGVVPGDPAQDVCKVALIERHRGSGSVVNAFVHGFGFKEKCAIASTVAHDSHHMLVVGTDDAHMALAANALAEQGGGMLVARDGAVRASIPMPIAGLMSDQRAEIVAAQARAVLAEYRACGCVLNNANMQLSLLALVVIPELRISDLGLVDVGTFTFVPVVSA